MCVWARVRSGVIDARVLKYLFYGLYAVNTVRALYNSGPFVVGNDKNEPSIVCAAKRNRRRDYRILDPGV